ncbi:hypothetical protein Hsar01_01809 [Haloferula sargassicola]|uniref:Uncharacterized protein n=1 Tax=Haloferula sargassicola TaxID=490096 RepID=A0ABP9UPH8_9BACT
MDVFYHPKVPSENIAFKSVLPTLDSIHLEKSNGW